MEDPEIAKVSDYSFRGQPKPVQNFKDEVYTILNYGKVGFPVVGAVPAWNTYEGELALFANTAATPSYRIYARLTSAWVLFASSPSGGLPDDPPNSVQFNSGGIFGGDAEFTWQPTGKYAYIQSSREGAYTAMVIANSQTAFAGSLGAAIDIKFGFEAATDNATIRVGKTGDYSTEAASDSYLATLVDRDGTLTEIQRATRDGVLIGLASSIQSVLQVGPELDQVTTTTRLFNVFGAGGDGLGRHPPYASVNYFGGLVLGDDFATSPGAALTIRNRAGQNNPGGGGARIVLDGMPNSAIDFYEGTEGAFSVAGSATALLGGIASVNVSGVGPPTGGVIYFTWTRANRTVTTGNEEPFILFGRAAINTSRYTHTFTSTDQVNQRYFHFAAPTATFSGGAGVIGSIATVSTVYIEAPPIVGSTSTQLLNRYALWIGTGDVLIGGRIVTGGNTTVTNGNGVLFTTTAVGVASNNASAVTLIRGFVGTTSLVANTFSEGRTVRLQAAGYYSTPAVPDTLTVSVFIGGTSVLTTGAQTPTASASTFGWSLDAQVTCWTTGGAGTLMGQGLFEAGSNGIGTLADWRMVGSSTVVMNTTQANIIEIRAQWAGAQATEQLYMTNCVGELLN